MRTVLMTAAVVVFLAAPAQAQVLEIADDGAVQTFNGAVGSPGPVSLLPRTRAGQFNLEDSLNRAARDYGLDPGLLHAVAWQESRGNNFAVSDKGAMGIMQLMPATAAALGVDPRDPEANVRGGAAYLALMLAKFGAVELALAAYNAGPAAVLRYGGVPPYPETRNYVSTIMLRWKGSAGSLAPARSDQRPVPAITQPQARKREPALPVLLIELPYV